MSNTPLDQLGPVDYIIVEFPAGASNFTGEMAAELLALINAGTIRHHTGDGPPTAAPAPIATGTTAAGRVRGRAPSIHRFTAVTVAF